MRNKNLIEYIKKLTTKREDNLKKITDGQINEYEIVQLKFENNSVIDTKISHLYMSLIDKIPDEKLEELKEVIKGFFPDEEQYKAHEKKVLSFGKDKTLRGILKGAVARVLDEHLVEVMDGIEKILDDKDIDKVVASEEVFIPKKVDNTPEYPFTEIVEKAKQSDKFKALDENKQNEISKQLDEINHLVTKSPDAFADAKRSFDNDFESLRNKETRQYIVREYNNPDKRYKEVFDLKEVDIEFSQKEDVTDNQDKIDYIKSFKYQLSDSTKQSILKVWNKMDEYNLCQAGEGNESGSKIYGFKNLIVARFELKKAIEENKFEELETHKNEYIKQLQYVRDMYQIVKDEIKPNPSNMPGNQENIRTDSIPAEFKNDLPLNASYNGLFNAYEIVKRMGITGEEFLNNPQRYLEEALVRDISVLEIDNYYHDKSFEQKAILAYGDRKEKGYNVFGVSRMIDLFNKFEKDEKTRRNNELFRTIAVGRVQLADKDDLFVNKYFSNDREGTLANVLLVRENDRDFSLLRSYDTKTPDRLHTIKAFDRAKYIKDKNILPAELYNNIKKFVVEAYKISEEENERFRFEDAEYDIEKEKFDKGLTKKLPSRAKAPQLSKEMFVVFMQNVQSTVQQYLLLKNPLETEGVDKLMNILKDPTTAFEGLNICNEYKREMANLKNKDKPYEISKKEAVKAGEQIIKDARTAEKTYNKSADTVLKALDKISAKINSESDENRVENLQVESAKKMNEFKLLQKNEIKRLQKEYKAGRLPKDYLDRRLNSIINVKHNEKTALFDDGFDKEQYFKETGLENLSKEEKKGICDSELERRQVAREEFFNKLYLADKNFIPYDKIYIEDLSEKINIINIDEIKQPTGNMQREQQNAEREPIEVKEADINREKNIRESKIEIRPVEPNKVINK